MGGQGMEPFKFDDSLTLSFCSHKHSSFVLAKSDPLAK